MAVTIYHGLHPHLRADAARLYWEAFGGKLRAVLGPDARALAFFERVIRADLCFAALDGEGGLVGLAGYKTARGSFAGGAGPICGRSTAPGAGSGADWCSGRSTASSTTTASSSTASASRAAIAARGWGRACSRRCVPRRGRGATRRSGST